MEMGVVFGIVGFVAVRLDLVGIRLMTAMIDTLQFAERFESAGFEHDKARALAAAFALANEAGREDLVTKSHLDTRLAEFETRITRSMAELDGRVGKQISKLEVRLTKQIGEVGNNLSNRLWSTVAIIAGVSTAISATVGAAVALLLRHGM